MEHFQKTEHCTKMKHTNPHTIPHELIHAPTSKQSVIDAAEDLKAEILAPVRRTKVLANVNAMLQSRIPELMQRAIDMALDPKHPKGHVVLLALLDRALGKAPQEIAVSTSQPPTGQLDLSKLNSEDFAKLREIANRAREEKDPL